MDTELSATDNAYLARIVDDSERLTLIISWIEVLEEDGVELNRSYKLIRDEIIRRGIVSDSALKERLKIKDEDYNGQGSV